MLDRLNNYNWERVFNYANPKACDQGHDHAHGGPQSVFGPGVSIASFTREDVEEIIAIEEDDDSELSNWIGVFRLRDGRWACIRLWHYYTDNWCVGVDGDSQVAESKQGIIRWGLSEEERDRLKLRLASQPVIETQEQDGGIQFSLGENCNLT